MTQTSEKRRHPRIAERLPVTPADGAALETINLSAGGLFCTSADYVAPMTRLSLSLSLPAGSNAPAKIEGEAVVVRTEPAAPSASQKGGYRIALFFSRLEEEHRRTLQAYLQSRSR